MPPANDRLSSPLSRLEVEPLPAIPLSERSAYNASSGFPLCLSVKRAPVAQRTERVASDHQVAGSIPAGRAILLGPRVELVSRIGQFECRVASIPGERGGLSSWLERARTGLGTHE
jgi:hypothetical protein